MSKACFPGVPQGRKEKQAGRSIPGPPQPEQAYALPGCRSFPAGHMHHAHAAARLAERPSAFAPAARLGAEAGIMVVAARRFAGVSVVPMKALLFLDRHRLPGYSPGPAVNSLF